MNEIVGYCRWVPSIYSNLSECFRNKKQDEMASYYQKIAENLKIMAASKHHSRHDILNIEMFRLPPKDLNEFIKSIV